MWADFELNHGKQADSLGAAKSTTPNLHFVLALLSLIFVFVLVVLAITLSVSFINFLFVVLFAALAIFLNLIFAYGRNASPRKASKPEE